VKSEAKHFAVGIRVTVVAVFMLATALTAALAIGLQYHFGRTMATEAATDLYSTASSGVVAKWNAIGDQNTTVIDLLSDNPALTYSKGDGKHLATIASVMERNPLYYGMYIGYPDGSFFELVNLDASRTARSSFRATPGDKWITISIDASETDRVRRLEYMDASFNTRIVRNEPTDFLATDRAWYTEAMNADKAYASAPYLFAHLGVPGRTLSKRISGTESVIGIDMTLDTMSQFLREQEISGESELFIYKMDGEIIASSREVDDGRTLPVPAFSLTPEEKSYIDSLPTLAVSNEAGWPPIDYTVQGKPQGYSIDVLRMVAAMTGLEIEFVQAPTWNELVAQFKEGKIDLLHSVRMSEDNAEWGLPSQPYADLPWTLVTREGADPISSMAEMAGRKLAIPSGWSIMPLIKENFPDVEVIATENTLDSIAQVQAGNIDAALDNEMILRYLQRHYFITDIQYHIDIDIDMGEVYVPRTMHILAQKDASQLLAIIDRAIIAIGAEEREYLNNQWFNYEASPVAQDKVAVPSDDFITAAADTGKQNALLELEIDGKEYFAYAANLAAFVEGALSLGVLVSKDAVIDPFLDRVKLSSAVTAGFLLLLLPLSWAFATPIVRPVRQLALENDKVSLRHYDDVQRVPSSIKEIYELSESMVEMVEAIKAHEIAQRELMDSFIQLIAQAIDDKSAYTGGHCERVPELALMLAERASASADDPFDQFKLDSDDEWREYRIAAWLHDCGKITTPEHIVDKGSKLETIYNRIHEVRMRFEALWRDAEIDFLKELVEHPENEQALREQLETQRARLQEDYAFIAECNVGGEFMAPEKQERLHEIAQMTWQRNFDDRIGLSPVEELTSPPEETAPLPATERLLQDRPDHLIERTRSTDYPPEYNINMDIPEQLYNLGEVYNLSIPRGTLTAEDRFKINEHMISTIKMLESLPFPDELKNVPRYASTHHETMRGSGYPRKLPGDQLSIPERILAVADVFEALTASDRPYKKAKPISVAIDILHRMVEDNHIDRDCFELFLREKVYLQYAERFLPASQIDEVDVSKYVNAA
jgi:HD-GYP domain-containing protein (c-di-GMP phosphodiesterase class II)/ABC-type amino acid transport substrate-binding protein